MSGYGRTLDRPNRVDWMGHQGITLADCRMAPWGILDMEAP